MGNLPRLLVHSLFPHRTLDVPLLTSKLLCVRIGEGDFSFSAREIEHVSRQGDSGDTALELSHQRDPFLNRDTKAIRSFGEVELPGFKLHRIAPCSVREPAWVG